MEKISINITVREENMGKKKVFVVSSEELKVSDFGDTLDEAIENFKKSANLFLDTYPSKKEELICEEKREITPPLITRIFL